MMEKKNSVYIATSLDGYIADKNGGIDWLDSIDIPEGEDMGYYPFMDSIDALLMGRLSFETVLGFDVDWPYSKPVFVRSNSLKSIPESHEDKAFLVRGPVENALAEMHSKGHLRIYADGGKTIQSMLELDLIDEMIITVFPRLLGGGISLFGELPNQLEFELVGSKVYAGHLVQNHFVRKR
jgi:dihydrofolate reductase